MKGAEGPLLMRESDEGRRGERDRAGGRVRERRDERGKGKKLKERWSERGNKRKGRKTDAVDSRPKKTIFI